MWTVDHEKAAVESETRVPFVIDICRATFDELQLLLTSLFDSIVPITTHADGSPPPPPSQFNECLVSSVLSILKLQVLSVAYCGDLFLASGF